jgi:receptor protein-tyrosine kinase
MTFVPKPRSHLVERAVEALGGRDPNPGGTAQPLPPPAARPAPRGADTVAEAPPAPLSEATPRPNISMELLKDCGLITRETKRTRLSEQIGVIQLQVLRTVRATAPAEGRNARLVLITSARPGEGKTFTALNIAASIATNSGQQALLVDADGKAGSITAKLGCGAALGLRSLAGDPSRMVAPLVLPTACERLSFLPYGVPEPGAPTLPPGPAIAAAALRIAAAMPRHIIILDTPPTLLTSEANTLAPVVGQVVLVVGAEQTQRSEIEAALDMVEACPTLQLMLNRARLTDNSSFGAYGYGAYGSTYDAPAGG